MAGRTLPSTTHRVRHPGTLVFGIWLCPHWLMAMLPAAPDHVSAFTPLYFQSPRCLLFRVWASCLRTRAFPVMTAMSVLFSWFSIDFSFTFQVNSGGKPGSRADSCYLSLSSSTRNWTRDLPIRFHKKVENSADTNGDTALFSSMG